MRPTGRAAMLAGVDGLVLCGDLIPFRNLVSVILRGVDIDAAHPGRIAHRQADQMFASPPPGPDLRRVGGRLLERSGAGDRLAVGVLVARRHRYLVDGHRKYWNA